MMWDFNRRSVLGCIATCAFSCSRRGAEPMSEAADLKPGQIWEYRTRAGEEGSRLTVLKIESHPKLGNIVHVALDGLHIRNPAIPGGSSSKVAHLPYQEAALRQSLTKPSGHDPGPANLEG